jgi:hypothetical protein
VDMAGGAFPMTPLADELNANTRSARVNANRVLTNQST